MQVPPPSPLIESVLEKEHVSAHLPKLLEKLQEEFGIEEEGVYALWLDWISEHPAPCFLLPSLGYLMRWCEEGNLIKKPHISHFEKWLNQNSGLSFEENREIRGKIVGKWVPRDSYQKLFPVGLDTLYEGTHIVSGHKSPDLDTSVASFFGWLDAFGAFISKGVHLWHVPGGLSKTSVEIPFLFDPILGKGNSRFFVTESLPKEEKSTLSLRDFSTPEEGDLDKKSDVISVIDHHKSHFTTSLPFTASFGDVQSANTLVAESAFSINDEVSLGGHENLDEKIHEEIKGGLSLGSLDKLESLIKKKRAALTSSPFFIDSLRESLEYLHFFYAILDDTDLLAKVTRRDTLALKELVNRLHSLYEKKEVRVVDFDDIKGEGFRLKAADKFLKTPSVYAMYSPIYSLKEEQVDLLIKETIETCELKDFFRDTKVLQEGQARVGQLKLFPKNRGTFFENASRLRLLWEKEVANDPFPLSLQMITTIASAKERFLGEETSEYDQLWLYVPLSRSEYGKAFLERFFTHSPARKEVVFIHYFSEEGKLFLQKALPKSLPIQRGEGEGKGFVFYVHAKKVNSRKGLIAPFLP